MVLKRLLVTTLGALGLGALAAGPASAQQPQIPAPDLFDGQVTCSTHVMSPQDAMTIADLTKALAMAVEDGEMIVNGDDLAAIIDPMGNNCSAGPVLNPLYEPDTQDSQRYVAAAGGLTDDIDKAAYIPLAHDNDDALEDAMAVGEGYTEALNAFVAARKANMEYDAAKKVVDEAGDDASDRQIKDRDDKYAAKMMADEDLMSVGNGPINMAGIAEWEAKFAVEKAADDYEEARMSVTAAETALAGDVTTDTDAGGTAIAYIVDYDDYVPVNSAQLLALFDDDENITIGSETASTLTAKIRAYANAEGDNVSTQTVDEENVIVERTGSSAFDAAGNLLVPMTFEDANDPDSPLIPTFITDYDANRMFSTVEARLEDVNEAVEMLEEHQSGNNNALLQPSIDEAVRRAKLEQGHYQAQFDAMIADDTDLRTDDQKPVFMDTNENEIQDDGEMDNSAFIEEYSLKSLYDEYKAANLERSNAGELLVLEFENRVEKTSAVVDAFTSAPDFYQQLVDRREYEKAQKELDVTKLAARTGDDAATEAQTKTAADAVTAAETALTAATDAQAAFQDLLAGPVQTLVEELLKGDDVGDDGGALVDTIVGAYDAAAAAAADAADAEIASTLASNKVAELTAVDDPATDEDETGAVTKNRNDIAALIGADGEVGMNTARIGANETTIDLLDTRSINEENARIDGDAALGVRIDGEEAARIAGDTALGGRIDTNVEMIGTNVDNIATNAANIVTEQTARMEADTMLGGRIDNEATARMAMDDELMGHITTNAGNIMANEMSIGANATAISSNADGIAANMNAIGSNAASIADNRNMIGELNDDLSVVRAGVAASMALAGMPAINGRGISIGVGSFDGESAFAVGFQIQGEMASFKVGLTSGGGATGASAGVGFQF